MRLSMQVLSAEIAWVLDWSVHLHLRLPGERKNSDILESLLSIGAFLKQVILWTITLAS